MKSAVVLAALVGFALINTAFLGVYLLSGPSAGTLSADLGGQKATTTVSSTVTSMATSTATSTATIMSSSTQNALRTNDSAPYASSAATTSSATTTSNASSGGEAFSASVSTPSSSASPSPFALPTLARFFENHSLVLAPTSWFFVGGMWIWRGRMKSKWTDLGFDSDVFGLFVRMKGAKTRIRLLDALSVPKDRLQLAQELGLDWKAVDRHVTILRKYGFVEDRVAYGKVRMYELTPIGKSLLHLLVDLSREERREGLAPAPPAMEQP